MNLVLQPSEFTCGQSCIAMIANVPVERVCALAKELRNIDDEGRGRIGQFALTVVLNYLGFVTLGHFMEMPRISRLPPLAVVRLEIEGGEEGSGHFVVWHDGRFYDPADGILEPQAAKAVWAKHKRRAAWVMSVVKTPFHARPLDSFHPSILTEVHPFTGERGCFQATIDVGPFVGTEDLSGLTAIGMTAWDAAQACANYIHETAWGFRGPSKLLDESSPLFTHGLKKHWRTKELGLPVGSEVPEGE